MIEIATFELIPTDELFDEMFYFSEMDPFSVNFESCGVESLLFLKNIGFMLIMILLHVLLVILQVCFHFFRNCCKFIKKVDQKLKKYLFWNGLQRFYMEIFFEIALLSALNIHQANWDT